MLVAVSGYANSGKDTFSNYLIEKNFARVFLAKPFKEALSIMTNTPVELSENRDFKEKPLKILGGKSLRYAYKFLGEIMKSEFNNNIWLELLKENIDDLIEVGIDNIVVTDVRRFFEAEYVRNINAVIVYIERPDLDLSLPLYQHISEKEQPKVKDIANIILNNDGTLDQFKKVCASVADFLISNEENDILALNKLKIFCGEE